MSTLFGLSLPQPYLYVFALVTILVLLALFGWLLRRFVGNSNRLEGGSRGRQPRLGLVDTFSVDRQRQLVIIRRDTVEHLLLIGGNSDLVIETNIVRSAPNAQRDFNPPSKTLSGTPQVAPSSFELPASPSVPQMPPLKMATPDIGQGQTAQTPMGSVQMPLAPGPISVAHESPPPAQIDRIAPRPSDLSEIARRFDRLTPTMRTEPVPPIAPQQTLASKGAMPTVSMAPLEQSLATGPADLEAGAEADVPETVIDPFAAPIIPLRDTQSPTDGLRRLLGRHQDS